MYNISFPQYNLQNISFEGRSSKIKDIDLFKRLISEGVNNAELAERFDVAYSTVVLFRRKLGLPSMCEQRSLARSKFIIERLQDKSSVNRKDVAKELGVCKGTVDRIAQKNDVYRISKVMQEQKIAQLVSQGFSASEIAKNIGVNSSTVTRIVSKLGLHLKKTTTEVAVLKGLSEGKSNKQVAQELDLTENTVALIKKRHGLTKKYNRMTGKQDFKWIEIASESKKITALRQMFMRFKNGERNIEILDEMSKTIEDLKAVVEGFKKRLQ